MRLVVGCGNPQHKDDGAGVYAAERVAKAQLPNVEIRLAEGFPMELFFDIHRYQSLLFVDVGVQVPEVQLIPVNQIPEDVSVATSHALVPGLMGRLSELLYGSKPRTFVCTILGEDFTEGAGLTEKTRQRADRAVVEILKHLG